MSRENAIQDVSQTGEECSSPPPPQTTPTPPSRPTRKENIILVLIHLIYVTSKKLLLSSKSFLLFYTISKWVLSASMILAISMFTYTAFYLSVMPTEIHEEDVNFQFVACPDQPGPCSYPNLTLELDPAKHQLMFGQRYTIAIELDLPDSVNNQELGMFMSCLRTYGKEGELLFESCKSSILEFSPLLLSGAMRERQKVRVTYTNHYTETPGRDTSSVTIEIKSKFIQIYGCRFQMYPQLQGLRRIMYHYHLASASLGMISIISLILATSVYVRLNLGSSLSTLFDLPHQHENGEKK